MTCHLAGMLVDISPPFESKSPVWRFSSLGVASFCVAVGVSLWIFWDGLSNMWGYWIDAPEYSHGLLIPFVSAFLIWQQKDRLERVRFEGSWWGVGLVLVGGAMLLLGQLATIYTVVQYAYLVTLFGLVLAFTGSAPFRLLIMPLFVLVFMIPLPQFVFANLSTKLQLLSSELGVWFIRQFGISVFLEGNVIDLGGYRLQVAEACDGLRYLFPLMTLGFIIAYFYKDRLWKRAVLFLSSIPITVIMNSFRIGTIGVMVEHWGIKMAEGFLHEFQGWVVFMVSALLMVGEIVVLNRIGGGGIGWRQRFGVEFPAPSPRGVSTRSRSLPAAFLAAVGMLLVFAAVTVLIPRPAEQFPTRTNFVEFPSDLGSWTGRRDSLESIYLDALKLDDYLMSNYDDGSGWPVNVYMAYYNSQRKGEAVHSPRSCLPGGGWQLREFGDHEIPGVKIGATPLRVNRTVIELGNQRQLVYYWFQQRGRVITNEFAVKWYLFWDALTRHRTDGALVRLIIALPATADIASADRRLTELAARVAPATAPFIPD